MSNNTSQAAKIERYDAAAVIGLGATGYSVVRYLSDKGLKVSVFDSRTNPPFAEKLAQNFAEVSAQFGEFTDEMLLDYELIVVSPGVSLNTPCLKAAKNSGACITGDIALFIQENNKPLLAITGSNGKSTVTTLVGDMCRSGGYKPLVAGNIGLPVLDALTDKIEYDVAVLELSSFQLETTDTVPAKAAAILNVSEDHMDRYDSMGDYVLAKARILRGAKRAVLPMFDEQLRQITKLNRIYHFGNAKPNNKREFGTKRSANNVWLMKGEKKLMKAADIPLIGKHNIDNVLAAFALVQPLDIKRKQKVAAVKQFKGLPHRMQLVSKAGGYTWVNDSKATNVGATSAALNSLDQTLVWIAGGQGKQADFSLLSDAVNQHLTRVIVFGEDAEQIAAALEGLVAISRVENMAEAVAKAAEVAEQGSLILLSPACASFDQYADFQARGDDFVHQIELWSERGAV